MLYSRNDERSWESILVFYINSWYFIYICSRCFQTLQTHWLFIMSRCQGEHCSQEDVEITSWQAIIYQKDFNIWGRWWWRLYGSLGLNYQHVCFLFDVITFPPTPSTHSSPTDTKVAKRKGGPSLADQLGLASRKHGVGCVCVWSDIILEDTPAHFWENTNCFELYFNVSWLFPGERSFANGKEASSSRSSLK